MKIIKSLIKATINKAGYDLCPKSSKNSDHGSMTEGLERLKQKGINPSYIVDVGAAQGTWTTLALKYWPDSEYELVEPLQEQKQVLGNLKNKQPNINFHMAVAGEGAGEVFLNITEDLDGSGIYGGNEGRGRKVPVLAIDDIVPPGKSCLIKLDTHGYEVPILKGASNTLQNTEALIVEVYGFRISPTCLVFHEITSFLESIGFRFFDIVDIMRTPSDNAFWQADAIYLRNDHKVFQSNSYS